MRIRRTFAVLRGQDSLRTLCLQMVQKQLKKTRTDGERKDKLHFLLKRMVNAV